MHVKASKCTNPVFFSPPPSVPVVPSSIPVIKLFSVLSDAQAPLADAALSVFMEWPSGNSRALQDAYQMSTDTCSIQ